MTVSPHTEDYIVTDRAGIVENRHAVHAAVVDSSGRLLYSVGNPARVTLARSTAKPAQALAILETGAAEHFAFDEADVALLCASHSSEDRHIARSHRMLARVPKLQESHLRCGGHPAVSDAVNRAWIRSGFVPTGICNNCSGKHVGMLAGAAALGTTFVGYERPEHPMQAHVRRVTEDLAGLDSGRDGIAWGVDGCNLPAPAMPLKNLARTFAGFAQAADDEEKEKAGSNTRRSKTTSTEDRTRNMARIFHAMSNHPEMVGGEGRFCTQLMLAYGGDLIGKLGADGCYGVGIRALEQTGRISGGNSEGQALGLAVKIEDGSIEMLYVAVMEILSQLRIGDREKRGKLRHFHYLERKNTMNVVTGQVTPVFGVHPVDELL
ncbi:L-asparaginase II [Apiospora arundinis]|uniref:L-asparaginase II n=1 Tax=Apiospora arundinis TaxID=335852 RepID=A0ABR2HZU0_9PEZI